MTRYFIFMLFICLSLLGKGQMLDGIEKEKVTQGIQETYTDWETVSISGKLKMKGLPLSPSLKAFMIRDSLLVISLRAPFVGEAGRCEITPDSILVVNKMKKNYVKEPLEEFYNFYPGDLSDLQNLLLARIVMPGAGDDFNLLKGELDVYNQEEGFAIIPGEEIFIDGFSYGYLANDFFRPTLLLIIPDDNPETTVTVAYDYKKKGYDITGKYSTPAIEQSVVLELDEPVYGSGSIDMINLNSKYTKVSPSAFMKSF